MRSNCLVVEVTFKQSVSVVLDYLHTRLHECKPVNISDWFLYFRLMVTRKKRVSLIFKLYTDYGYFYFSKNKYHFQWMFYHAEVWIHNKQEASHNLPLHKSSTITFTQRLSNSYLEEDSQNLSYKIRNLQKLNLPR